MTDEPSRRKFTRRAAVTAGGIAAIGVIAAGLRGTSRKIFIYSTAGPRTLNRGNGAEPDTLDPHKASGNWENNIIGDMLMGLMTEDAAANAVLGAAESYTRSADGLTFTFKIRDHAWSDGVPVTAQDFVYSLRRIADPRTAAQYVSILYGIENMQQAAEGKVPPGKIGARAVDDRTLELRFIYQVPYIAQLFTHFTTFPVPRHVVEKYGDDWLKPENIVVNGPYRLAHWVPNDHILLTKNPRFYDAAKVRIDKVYYYPTQDAAAALKRFRGGEFDLLFETVPSREIGWLRRNMAKELMLQPLLSTAYIQFNMTRKPFDDPRVREALSLAVDRETLCNRVLRLGDPPAYSLVPPGMPDYPGKAQLRYRALPMAARIEKAKRLLAEAGFGPQNPLRFDYNAMHAGGGNLTAVVLQAMWKTIGAEAQIVTSEAQVHYDLLRKHDFAVCSAGWVADYRDPRDFLFLFQTSSPEMNYGLYSNPRYDALMAQSDQIGDSKARALVLEQAEQILLDDTAIIPILFEVAGGMVSPQVKNWIPNAVDINRTRYLWLDRSIKTA